MKAIVIDDEPMARQGIEILVAQIPYIELIGSFSNPIAAQEFILSTPELDLIFLDVEMPVMPGVEYLKAMPPKCQVILTTAYQQYALEAFELDVLDYLLKPIRLDRFVKAVSKAKEIIELQKHEIEIDSSDTFIFIKSDRKFIKLELKDITYIKGLKDYVIIHTIDTKYMTAMNVSTILKQLPADMFTRVSKSYIINVDRVTTIDVDTITLGEIEIPLGNAYKEKFLSTFVKDKLVKRK